MRPGSQPTCGGLGGEAEAGQGRQHQVERVPGGAAVRGGIRERAHDAEQLDDRAGPAVRDDQRHALRRAATSRG